LERTCLIIIVKNLDAAKIELFLIKKGIPNAILQIILKLVAIHLLI